MKKIDRLKLLVKIILKKEPKKIKLNDIYYIIVFGDTITLNFYPKDARHFMTCEGIKYIKEKFDDALKKIGIFLNNNPNILRVVAISHLIRDFKNIESTSNWFEDYGFDVTVGKIKGIPKEEIQPELLLFVRFFPNYNKIGLAEIDSDELIKHLCFKQKKLQYR